jgi:hypothetical protein
LRVINNINDFIVLAKRIHDAEEMDFGSSSTRDSRNRQWARIVGIAHHGHPVYNPTPDPRWHLKNGGGGRPQSDDVVVLMPERAFWDCIVSAGTKDYYFHVGGHADPLPPEQEVYPPPVPDGSAPQPNPNPGTPPPNPGYPPSNITPPVACNCKADLERVTSALVALTNTVASQASVLAGLNERLDEEWAARVWSASDPEQPPVVLPEPPVYQGRVLGTTITLRPVK